MYASKNNPNLSNGFNGSVDWGVSVIPASFVDKVHVVKEKEAARG
jgi:hypothetical protein